jgi:hypothetical protein
MDVNAATQLLVCSCYAGILLGMVSVVAFTLLWRHVKVYQSRQYLRQVAFKPPDVPSKKLCGWEMPWCALHCNRLTIVAYSQ